MFRSKDGYFSRDTDIRSSIQDLEQFTDEEDVDDVPMNVSTQTSPMPCDRPNTQPPSPPTAPRPSSPDAPVFLLNSGPGPSSRSDDPLAHDSEQWRANIMNKNKSNVTPPSKRPPPKRDNLRPNRYLLYENILRLVEEESDVGEEAFDFSSDSSEEYFPNKDELYTSDREDTSAQTYPASDVPPDSPPPTTTPSTVVIKPRQRKRQRQIDPLIDENKLEEVGLPRQPPAQWRRDDLPMESEPAVVVGEPQPMEAHWLKVCPNEPAMDSTKFTVVIRPCLQKRQRPVIEPLIMIDENEMKEVWLPRQPPAQQCKDEPPMEPEPVIVGGEPTEASWLRVYPNEPAVDVSSKFNVTNPGPTCLKFENPLQYFFLFFTTAMWDLFVTETNKYGTAKLNHMQRSGLFPQSRIHRWVNVTVDEMKKYISVLLSMGMTYRKTLTDYWSTDPVLHLPFFSRTMKLRRFQLITSMLHLSSRVCPPRGEVGYDPWVKIREFIDMMNRSFKTHFIPSQNVHIDESMVGIKNRATFIQYMPNKRHSRFGIKKFELCDSKTGYVLQSVLYSSRYFLSRGSDPFTQKVVIYLMGKVGLLDKGYHLFTDNFYTKILLARLLSVRNTFLTGTINERSKDLSKTILNAQLQVDETLYYRRRFDDTSSVLLVKYIERKTKEPVLVISNCMHAQDIVVVSKNNRVSVKPVMIKVHNEVMGGVDSKNKSVYHLSCARASSKYWRKIVYNFIDMALLNAYILYTSQHDNNPMPRSKFNISIIKQLSSSGDPLPLPPVVGPGGDAPQAPRYQHDIVLMENRAMRMCIVCKRDGKGYKHRGTYVCTQCQNGVHYRCRDRMNIEVPCVLERRRGRQN